MKLVIKQLKVVSHPQRGKIVCGEVKPAITLNRKIVRNLIVEIDHINHGLIQSGSKKGYLKPTRRQNLSMRDIADFLGVLDGEEITSEYGKKEFEHFEIELLYKFKSVGETLNYKVAMRLHSDGTLVLHIVTLFNKKK